MNKKAQDMKLVGAIILAIIAVIVGLSLMTQSANTIGGSRNTLSVANISFTSNSVANGTTQVTGRDGGTGLIVLNSTLDDISSQYELVTIRTGNTLNVNVKTLDAAVAAASNGTALNASYTYNPSGYMNDSSSRTIFGLPLIFMAIALMLAGLWAKNQFFS